MIELPRNPVDFKIDDLSQAALERLLTWGEAGRHLYYAVTPWMQELVDEGLAAHAGGEFEDGRQTAWIIERTFSGFEAAERYKCGIYHHHKKIYEARAARDRALVENPLFGQW